MHVTTQVHNRLLAFRERLLHERLVAVLAGQVDDKRGVLREELADGVEDLRDVTGAEEDHRARVRSAPR